MAYIKARIFVITATARKLAVIIWNMVTSKEQFNYVPNDKYIHEIRAMKIASIKKKQLLRHSISLEEIYLKFT